MTSSLPGRLRYGYNECELQHELSRLQVCKNDVSIADVYFNQLIRISDCTCRRDRYGHFCEKTAIDGGDVGCKSIQELCRIHLNANQQTCPSTCNECTTWEHSDPSVLWMILTLISFVSPVLVWAFLPFLRGRHDDRRQCCMAS